jgi:hypothetical protein
MRMADISPGALETWGKLAPKSTFAWIRKIVVVLSVLVLPWFLLSWQHALLYVLLTLYITNEATEAIPVIVALAKQELLGSVLGGTGSGCQEHVEKFDPKKESWEHFMGKSALLILEERRRGETWNPEKESIEEFMRRKNEAV